MTLLRRLPRWFNRLYARALGYFWIPCPVCGRDFGGHETSGEALINPKSETIMIFADGRLSGTGPSPMNCWRCARFVREENQRRAAAICGREKWEQLSGEARSKFARLTHS